MTQTHGILALKSIFQAEEEAIPDSGIMAGRTLYAHWAYIPSDVTEALRENYISLQSGDILTIFKTAVEGPLLWEGTVNLENERTAPDTGEFEKAYDYGVRGLQAGMSSIDWSRMFADQRPAALTREGQTIYGNLEQFDETGSEAIIWSLNEWGKKVQESTCFLQDGDRLKIFDHVTGGDIAFQGKLTLMPKFTEAVYNGYYKEKFQMRPMEIFPNDLMTYCVSHMPVTVSRPS